MLARHGRQNELQGEVVQYFNQYLGEAILFFVFQPEKPSDHGRERALPQLAQQTLHGEFDISIIDRIHKQRTGH